MEYRLGALLQDIQYEVTHLPAGKTLQETTVTDVVNDSRRLSEGCLFLAIKGMNSDGHAFVAEAFDKKAAAVVVQDPVTVPKGCESIVITVRDTRAAMAQIAAAYYCHPARKLKTVGITGTKGKTTTTYMVKSMLENAGIKTGLVGTIEVIIGDEHIPALNTTPESLLLQEYLYLMVNAGLSAVVMEVSSQALKLHRTDAILFDVGIFTNLEADHIGAGEHEDFADYLHCKSLLFSQCKTGIVNADDAHMEAILTGHTCAVKTYAIDADADMVATDISLTRKSGELGVAFTFREKDEADDLNGAWLKCPTPGRFSVYNALCAVAVARLFHCDAAQTQDALMRIHVKGRIERVKTPCAFTVIIDYAHNAMALNSLLHALREYRPARLITLFGCGGNRARDRRFEMGEVSGRMSDLTVITSDNPRNEDPGAIIADIVTGIKKTRGAYVTIPDRVEAIRYCLENGDDGDIIVLAGKGHEDYQEIKGKKYPMDERVIVEQLVRELTPNEA